MARWQLTEPHYLNTLGSKWEFETKDRATGRSIRKQFPVPTLLDPNIEGDWNYRDAVGNNMVDGSIIVCWEGKGEPRDIVFEGPPTPGMLPLDDEAKEISSKFDWIPTQGLDDNSQFNSFAQQTLIKLTSELKNVQQQPQIEGMPEFMKMMAEMMKVQTETLALLAGRKIEVAAPTPTQEEELARIAKEQGIEPVFDLEPPLPAPPKTARRA